MKYAERHFAERGRIEYTLTDDSLSIAGPRGAHVTLRLKGLEPDYEIVRLRSPAFYVGLVGLVVATIFALLGAAGFVDGDDATDAYAFAVIAGVISLLCVIPSWRKVERAVFMNATGVPAFDIARAGPDRSRFHAFIDELSDKIRAAKELEG